MHVSHAAYGFYNSSQCGFNSDGSVDANNKLLNSVDPDFHVLSYQPRVKVTSCFVYKLLGA